MQAAPHGVEIREDVSPRTATVGDRIRILLTVSAPAHYRIDIQTPAEGEDFSILEETRTSSATAHRAQIIAAAYRTGTFRFPPIPVRITAPEGKEFSAFTPGAVVEIKSVIAGEDPRLKDLKRQEEIPGKTHARLWLFATLTLCILGALAWRAVRRRRRVAAAASAAEKTPAPDGLSSAEAELQRLLSSGFTAGAARGCYILLSNIIRKIVENGLGVPAMKKTTSEIVGRMRLRRDVADEITDRVESLLSRCDLVKFAGYTPSPAEHETAAKEAVGLLAVCRDRPDRGL